MIDNELRQAMAGLLDGEPTQGVDVQRALDGGRSAQRLRQVKVGLSCALAAVVVGVGVSVASSALVTNAEVVPVVTPTPSPGLVAGAVPVWYDAKGLHRGDVVEQTPFAIDRDGGYMAGALALVRSGALYLDSTTGDVWFHPWGGQPRIVGRNSETGPGGDANGDTAAWFEGYDLVVYDTAGGREISRTSEVAKPRTQTGDHNAANSGLLQVSAEHVVWQSYDGDIARRHTHDVSTHTTLVVEESRDGHLVDVHDRVEFLRQPAQVLRAPGLGEVSFPELEPRGRLSPSGNYLLAVEASETRHAAAIVDTRTGELWQVPKNAYPWLAWSYGDIALVDTERALLACDAARRTCEPLPAERPFLMPTN